MANTTDFRKGLWIQVKEDIYRIEDFQHVKPGKGGALVRTKLKHLITDFILEKRFIAGESIQIVRIIHKPYQFLYQENQYFYFMDQETFEQITLPKELIPIPEYLKEGQEVKITFHEPSNKPLRCQLPSEVVLQVTYTEPGQKGDTATKAMKPATLETGASILVPLFIQTGEAIKVNTLEKIYIERAK